MWFSNSRKTSKGKGIVGLAIRCDGVALAHVIPSERGAARLVACEHREVESPERISRAVTAWVREQEVEGTPCVAVLPRSDYSLHLLDAPDVEPEELGAACQWLVKDLLDFGMEEAVTDFFELPDQATRGRPGRIYVVAAQASAIQRVVDITREAALALEAIDITELALRNVTTLLPEDEQGMAFVQLRADRGSIAVTQQGRLYLARTLETGIDQLAGSAEAFEPESDLKFDTESDRFEPLLLELHRSLDFYESQLGQPPVANLVVAPLEREMVQLVPYLEKNLSANVRGLNVNELLDCDDPIPAPLQARSLGAIGGALRKEAVES